MSEQNHTAECTCEKPQRCECGDCDWEGTTNDLELSDIQDIFERIDPGSEVPAGECPECGALAYVLAQDNHYNSGERKLVELIARIADCQNYTASGPVSAEFGKLLKDCEKVLNRFKHLGISRNPEKT